jgi:dienelactone hydrolase
MKRLALSFLVLSLVVALPLAPQALPGPSSLAGTWSGSLDSGGARLPLLFHITLDGDKLSATMDSPSQGAKGIACSSVTLEGDRIVISLAAIKGGFSGRLSTDGTSIAGTWSQGTAQLPLVLTRGDGAAKASRPQTPRPPFPYTSEEARFQGGAPGVSLAATLTLPAGKGPFPAVVLVTGSGPQDRDETILGHKPFLVLADYLSRRGIAVLRYDDRGVAASTGDFGRATTLDFAEDARAAVDWLASRPGIDPARVGLIGHSEGGLIAPIVAAGNSAVSFIVLLSGPGLRGSELLLLQTSALIRAGGGSEEALSRAVQVNSRLYAIAASPGDPAVTLGAVKKAYLDWVEGEGSLSPAERAEARASADSIAAGLVTPWMRCFLTLDPAPYYKRLSIPVLALGGTRDLQVPPDENFAAIAKALAADGLSSSLTMRKFEGLNHLFQHAKTGLPAEYGTIDETIAPEALKAIGDWMAGLGPKAP